MLSEQVDLEKVVGKHDKDNLLDDHGKGAGGKLRQVAETLELSVSFFDFRTDRIIVSSLDRGVSLPGIHEKPLFAMAVGIVLAACRNAQRHRA